MLIHWRLWLGHMNWYLWTFPSEHRSMNEARIGQNLNLQLTIFESNFPKLPALRTGLYTTNIYHLENTSESIWFCKWTIPFWTCIGRSSDNCTTNLANAFEDLESSPKTISLVFLYNWFQKMLHYNSIYYYCIIISLCQIGQEIRHKSGQMFFP